ncbi:hypothetical protein G6F61_014373 [Rhizopus arrhizus]|nr:hypothetical protein G6F61_014373 [Rhizopus arrhizus]
MAARAPRVPVNPRPARLPHDHPTPSPRRATALHPARFDRQSDRPQSAGHPGSVHCRGRGGGTGATARHRARFGHAVHPARPGAVDLPQLPQQRLL